MNNGVLHTELMIVLVHGKNVVHAQVPQHHFTLSVYAGKDDHKGLKQNVGSVLEQLAKIDVEGFLVDHSSGQGTYLMRPAFALPCDMATHWGLYNCGGVHDPLFCHRCTTHRAHSANIYDWLVLPEHPDSQGARWSLHDVARKADMHVEDLVYLNSYGGVKEENLQRHCMDFRLPEVCKPVAATRGMSWEEQEHLQQRADTALQAALKQALGHCADNKTFAACTALVGTVAYSGCLTQADAEAGRTWHLGPMWCGCEQCTLPAGMRVRVFATVSMNWPISDSVIWKVPHWRTQFCALHALMRVEEKLMGLLQTRVIEHGSDRAVADFNVRMKRLGCGFRIRYRAADADLDTAVNNMTSAFKPVKLNGNTAM
eukprot:2261888-Rhodomonas_salina.1